MSTALGRPVNKAKQPVGAAVTFFRTSASASFAELASSSTVSLTSGSAPVGAAVAGKEFLGGCPPGGRGDGRAGPGGIAPCRTDFL